jgi:small conductance mechanosensitive channel
MVKDFLTGFTIVIEDIIRVGDVASVSGCTGVVEKITIRKLQMRDFAGIVYTIPFSQITTIQNLTKDYSYYVMDVGVSYAQNTDEAVAVMKEVDAELRHDPDFSALILEPIEIVGVERFDDSAVIIRARIKTRPIKQWDVGREFNRRMKMAFDKKGIEIPFQQRVITIRNEV